MLKLFRLLALPKSTKALSSTLPTRLASASKVAPCSIAFVKSGAAPPLTWNCALAKFAPTRIAEPKFVPLIVVLPPKSTPYRYALEKSVPLRFAFDAVAQLQVEPVGVPHWLFAGWHGNVGAMPP